MARINQAFLNKLDEYSKESLEDLEELLENSKLSNTYRMALQRAISIKKNEATKEEEETPVKPEEQAEVAE